MDSRNINPSTDPVFEAPERYNIPKMKHASADWTRHISHIFVKTITVNYNAVIHIQFDDSTGKLLFS